MQVSRLILYLVFSLASHDLAAQKLLFVWEDKAPPYYRPHTLEEYEADCFGVVCAYQVVSPTLMLYLPESTHNGTAVVIVPGGGYEVEAVYHEGYEIAQWLASHGVVAAVLKYRLPNPESSTRPELTPAADVRQALSVMRNRQEELGFKADEVGLMGFSAGSHLAAGVSVNRSENPVENPDFSILVYGVSRLTRENREWLEKTLFHRPMTKEEIRTQTLLERIDSGTPPAFLVHAYDDVVCDVRESTFYAEALAEKGVEVEMHLFPRGGHGFGAGRKEDGTDQWLPLALNWLERLSVSHAHDR